MSLSNAQGMFGDEISSSYRYGGITGQALPFIAEFYLTGGGFKAIGEGLSGALEKGFANKIKNDAARWMVKKTGVLVSDVARATAMANTTGAAKVASGVINRHIGDVYVDDNGKYKFSDGKSWGRSTYEEEAAQTLEYFTEMVGGHLHLGNWLAAGADKIGLARLSKALTYLANNSSLEYVGVQDFPSEVMEEEINMVLNAIMVGDNNFSTGPLKELANRWFGADFKVDKNSEEYRNSIFNPDAQGDIIGGMFWSIGMMNAPKYIQSGYYYGQSKRYEHKVDIANNVASSRLTPEKWEPLREKIDGTTNDEMGVLMNDILRDSELNNQEKKAVLDYIGSSVTLRGYNTALMAYFKNDTEPDEKKELAQELGQSQMEGYEATDADDMQDVQNLMEMRREELLGVVDEETVARLDEDPIGTLSSMIGEDTDVFRQKAIEYVNAKAAYDGMIQRVSDDIDTRIKMSEEEIDGRVNRASGQIHPAVMKDGDRRVYIVDGKAVMTEDEEMVDYLKSDESLIVRDAESGKIEFIDPHDLLTIDESVNPEQEKIEVAQNIRDEYAQREVDKMNGTLAMAQGDSYDLIDDEGKQHHIEIVADNGNGTVTAMVDGVAHGAFPTEVIQGMADFTNKARLAEKMAAAEEETHEVEESVGEGETPSAKEEAAKEEAAEGTDMATRSVDASPSTSMPMIGEEPDFANTTPERGHKYVYEEAGLSHDEANQFIEANKKAADEALGRAMNAKPKMGTSLAKWNRDKAAWEEKVNVAQVAADYWNRVSEIESALQVERDKQARLKLLETEDGRAQMLSAASNDADGKEWRQVMNNTYGYLRGTEGVDGDHIDVFLSDHLDDWNGTVYVVDQVDESGNFDEHKVMYGFNSMDEAEDAYLSNYEDGWQGLGAITGVSKEEFKKWVDSSHRKTKPFAEYKSVRASEEQNEGNNGVAMPLQQTEEAEKAGAEVPAERPSSNGKENEDVFSQAERIAREYEVRRTAAHFPEETPEEAAAFDKRVPDMSDEELLAYMEEDGHGDVNKAHHPLVYDEYDARHDEEYTAYVHQTDEAIEDILSGAESSSGPVASQEETDAIQRIADMLDEAERRWADGGSRSDERTALMAQMDTLNEWLDRNVREQRVDEEARRKHVQNEIIQQTNPMLDNIHTGIRSVDDIKTFEEAYEEGKRNGEEGGWEELASYPDITNEMIEEARRTGRITVYSSYPIKNGVFVTPSRMQAKDYAGEGKVYSKEVPVEDVAWIDLDEGQYAKVEETEDAKGVSTSLNKAETALRNAVAKVLNKMGIKTHLDEKAQRILDIANDTELMGTKKSVSEPAVGEESPLKAAVISETDVAKVAKELETTIKKSENLTNEQKKHFIADIAKALGAKQDGSKSEYVTIETKNGEVTLRLADHNTKVSNFDNRGESEGISIVISRKPNKGVENDGNAHVVEFFYKDKDLRNSDDKPYAQIARSIQQVLYSGEYKDTTGLTKPEEVNALKFFRTKDGQAYGFTLNGEIYLDPRIATAETPIHEYGHLWGEALREVNQKAWEQLKKEMFGQKDVLDYVQSLYPELKGDELAEEVFTHFAGKRGAERLRTEQERLLKENGTDTLKQSRIITMFNDLRNMLSAFWEKARDLFAGKVEGIENVTGEQFADMMLSDLMGGFNPNEAMADATEKADGRIKEQREADENIRFRTEDAPVFVSNARRAVEGIKQEKATLEQWLAMIEKNGGLKAGEDKWLGLSDWLKEKEAAAKADGHRTLTKQEVLDFIRENQIEVLEVEYTEHPAGFEELKKEYDGWLREEGYDYAQEQLRERFGDDAEIAFDDVGDELVISNGDAASVLLGSEKPINETRLDYTTEGLENKKEIALTVPSVESWNEDDEIHFGDADNGTAVAWVRFGETRDKDGKRVLVIDEIQSKRHQEGREKGYRTAEAVAEEERLGDAVNEAQEAYDGYTRKMGEKYNGAYEDIYADMTDGERAEADRLEQEVYDASERLQNHDVSGIPDAPFEKNWHELAMKRMLRYAAENGFDKVAWTTGEQQAERYNIGDVVERIISYDFPETADADGRKSKKIEIRLKNSETMTMRVGQNGKVIEGRSDTEGKTLSDVVGKELARSILNGEGRDGSIYDANRDIPAKVIDGEGLRIGGEGMKGFYDEMLPRFMNKYGKKWGVKVGGTHLDGLSGANGLDMWSVDVTPEMRESVMQGQVMFREGDSAMTSQETEEELDREYMDALNVVEKPARIEKLRKSEPVKVSFSNDYPLERGAAKKWAKGNIKGAYTNADTKEEISVSNVSIDKVTSHGEREEAHLKSIKAIPQMIERSIFIDEVGNEKENGRYNSYRYYVCGLTIDGQPYTAKVVVGVKNGRRYYDHELTQIEKGELIDGLNGIAKPVAENNSPISEYKDKRLLSLLQTNGEEISRAEEKMRSVLDEMARRRGYTSSSDYQGSLAFNGAAPSRNAYFDTKEERKAAFEDGSFEGDYSLGDFVDSGLDNNDLEWQIENPIPASARDRATLSSLRNLRDVVKGKKRTIKMYRAVDASVKEDSFRNGDWVTPSREYAEQHIGLQDWKEGRIIEQEVSIDDIWWNGDDINEWGYDDGKGYAYKNTENNRKLTDLVTRDEAGNVIPPSKRFDEGKQDVMFRESEDAMLDRLVDEMGYFAALARKTMKGGGYSKAQRETYARAEWRRAHRNTKDLTEKLHIADDIVVVDSADQIPAGVPMSAKKREAKGWYDTKTGKIYVILGNHLNSADVMQTLLHEAVAHYGLRRLFGSHFDTFLDSVLDNVTPEIRQKILDNAAKNKWSTRESVEEYLAGLAEDGSFTEFGKMGIWDKIKNLFKEMLRDLGLGQYYGELSDNELRYILWRSYKHLEEPEYYKSVFGLAEDIAMQYSLAVGNYGKRNVDNIISSGRIDMSGWGSEVADGDRFRASQEIDLYDKDGVNKFLSDIAKQHPIKGGSIWQPVHDDADIEAIASLIPDRAAKSLREAFGSELELGYYSPALDVMFIFPQKCGSFKKLEEVFWHERIHKIAERIVPEERAKMLEYIKKNNPKKYNFIVNNYEESERGKEAVAYFVSDYVKNGGIDSFLSEDFASLPEISTLAALIQNSIQNERERRTGLYNSNRPNSLYEGGNGEGTGRPSGTPGRAREKDEGARNSALNYDGIQEGEEESFDSGRLRFEESITKALLSLASKNKQNLEVRMNAIRALGGNLQILRSAMARQREYDRSTVNMIVRLARMLIDSGFVGEMTPTEVKRLLAMVNNSAGREDISGQAEKIVELITSHQLRQCRDILNKQISIRGAKVSQSGVEVQGKLDLEGQRMVATLKEAMTLDEKSLNERLGETLERMGEGGTVGEKNAAIEYQGLLLGKQFLDDIKGSEAEEKNLKHELEVASEDWKSGGSTFRDYSAYKEYVASVNDAIRQNRLERIEAYHRLYTSIADGLRGSIEKARDFRERETARANEIRHNANSDLEGVSRSEHSTQKWRESAANWGFVRALMKPMATFDEMLRFFGSKSVDGRGYLWNRFFRDGFVKSNDTAWRNLMKDHEELDAKVREIFGRRTSATYTTKDGKEKELPKVRRWSDLFGLEREMPTMTLTIKDAGEDVNYELSQGNLLYIYMVDKMSDGRMKLRKMGITEEDVEGVKDFLDPRFIELADWMQNEFLVKKREDYNIVHERLFGAPMASIDNYFPLKINSRSRGQEVDPTAYSQDGETKPSDITGAIVKRKRNSIPLDITHADAFDVMLEHLQQMEHWAAFAEMNHDLKTLLSYKVFRNRVKNMSSMRLGSGETLWKNFETVCAIAAGVYHPKVDKDSIDSTVVNLAKGVTAAKISLRLFTAFKQLLSYPAYGSEASIVELVKTTNPYGAYKAWNWAIENLPGFAERWQSRQAGDSRLKQTDSDWQLWRSQMVEKFSRIGMSPNAFVDALTVVMGAKAIYETKLKRYKKDGYAGDVAKERALREASIAYNETQQSSENGYLSAMQLDRTVASVALTVFRNSSMGYQRRFLRSLVNLKRKARKGYRKESIEFMTKQLVRDGLTEEQAKRAAERAYRRSWVEDIANVLIFGYGIQFAWNLGAYLPYLIFGDDDDKKKEFVDDVFIHSFAGGIEGLSGGSVMSDLANMGLQYVVSDDEKTLKTLSQKASNYEFNLLPLMSDLQTTLRHFANDNVAGWNDILNLLIQSGFGLNPQTLTDMCLAIDDAVNGDLERGKEIAMMLLRIANIPQSQLDELYLDEVGLTARVAQQLSVGELAKRYATYKRKRGAYSLQWAYDEEEKAALEEKYEKRFQKRLQERLEGMSEDKQKEAFEAADENGDVVLKNIVGKELAKTMDGKDTFGKKATAPWQEEYQRERSISDLAEDILLQKEAEKAKESNDEPRMKQIAKMHEALNGIRKRLALDVEDREGNMEKLRLHRQRFLKALDRQKAGAVEVSAGDE